MKIEEAKQQLDAVADQVETVIVGKRQVIELTITAMLAGGHVLFEDMPGVGKTTLARALARTMTSDFRRIQFTPDLLPSDIVGVSVFNRKTSAFEFQPGPVFTTFLLADELNRATPRTQSALLEAMGEKRVTIDGQSHPLAPGFFVMATQNPADYEGTYPLPEAQLDRFLMRLSMGYPTFESELALLQAPARADMLANLQPVMSENQLAAIKELVQGVTIAEPVLRYILKIVAKTREDTQLRLGVSPRGALALVAAAKAYAVVQGRLYVTPDDVQFLVPLVFGHRVFGRPGASEKPAAVLAAILEHVEVPVRG